MFRIKRLYSFILQAFIPIFAMTFGICLFIVLMQFLWKYVEEMVGKGLEGSVFVELFLYSALAFIPTALPLAILLASLMTFGNMGERLELLAIKASGVSLFKAMSPLIILISFIAIGAFFFQNEALPRIIVKQRTLLTSVKQKSPELDIPEGSFYNAIDGYSIYVKKKDKETRMLHDVMIYNTSSGFNDMMVFVCDSAKMSIADTKDFLLLNLYSGERFSSSRDFSMGSGSQYSSRNNQYVPYSRETFKQKDIVIDFDTNFDRMDESAMSNSGISMNLKTLAHSRDSVQVLLDSLNSIDRKSMANLYLRNFKTENTDTLASTVKKTDKGIPILNFDSLISALPRSATLSIYEGASASEENNASTFLIQSYTKETAQFYVRQYKWMMHEKYTLSFACLIFFFIGAPLGAIIRKGGLGMPVIISVVLFIIYYILNTLGIKMARDGIWYIPLGMWFSSMILFPLGVFLTYKAMNDSAMFNAEAYSRYFRKLLRIGPAKKLTSEERNSILRQIPSVNQLSADTEIVEKISRMDIEDLKKKVMNKQSDDDNYIRVLSLAVLKDKGVNLDQIIDQQDKRVKNNIFGHFKKSILPTIVTFFVALACLIIQTPSFIQYAAIAVYVYFFLRTLTYYFDYYKTSVQKKTKLYNTFILILALFLFPIICIFMKKQIEKDINNTESIIFSE